MRNRKEHSAAVHAQIVQQVLDGTSITFVADDLHVSSGTIINRVQRYRNEASRMVQAGATLSDIAHHLQLRDAESVQRLLEQRQRNKHTPAKLSDGIELAAEFRNIGHVARDKGLSRWTLESYFDSTARKVAGAVRSGRPLTDIANELKYNPRTLEGLLARAVDQGWITVEETIGDHRYSAELPTSEDILDGCETAIDQLLEYLALVNTRLGPDTPENERQPPALSDSDLRELLQARQKTRSEIGSTFGELMRRAHVPVSEDQDGEPRTLKPEERIADLCRRCGAPAMRISITSIYKRLSEINARVDRHTGPRQIRGGHGIR
jgi:transposase-like protein